MGGENARMCIIVPYTFPPEDNNRVCFVFPGKKKSDTLCTSSYMLIRSEWKENKILIVYSFTKINSLFYYIKSDVPKY